MKWLIFLLSWSLPGPSVFANEIVRPFSETDLPGTSELGVFVPGCRVAFFNEPRLRLDFPELAYKSRSEIEAWILDRYSYVSAGQLQLLRLRNTAIPFDSSRTVTLHRPSRYGRAALLNGMDIKGIGLSPPDARYQLFNAWTTVVDLNPKEGFFETLNRLRLKDHSDGLLSLGEAVAETTRQMAVQRLFDLRNSVEVQQRTPLETVETYFVLSYPFGIFKSSGDVIPAGLYARQMHYGRAPSGARSIPKDIYVDDHGGFQFSSRYSAVDFGGVIVTDSRLRDRFGVRPGGEPRNPQDSLPWSYGHEAARAFADGDSQAVERHVAEMLAPIDREWRALESTQRLLFLGRPHSPQDPQVVLSWLGNEAQHRREMLKWMNSDNNKVALFSERLSIVPNPLATEFFKVGLDHQSVVVQRYTASALERSKASGLEPFVLSAAQSKDSSVRNYAYRAVHHLRDELRFGFVIIALTDSVPENRFQAIRAIEHVPASQRALVYRNALADTTHLRAVVTSLRGADFPGLVEIVAEGIEKSNPGDASHWLNVFRNLKSQALLDWALNSDLPLVKGQRARLLGDLFSSSENSFEKIVDWAESHPDFLNALEDYSVLPRLEKVNPDRAFEIWTKWVGNSTNKKLRGQILLTLQDSRFRKLQDQHLSELSKTEKLRWFNGRVSEGIPLYPEWWDECLSLLFIDGVENISLSSLPVEDPGWLAALNRFVKTHPELAVSDRISKFLGEISAASCPLSLQAFFR